MSERGAARSATDWAELLNRVGLMVVMALISLLLLSAPALADDAPDDEGFAVDDEEDGEGPDWASTGPYILATANFALEDFKNEGPLDWDNAGGTSLRVGYRLLPRLAVETQVEWFNFDANGGVDYDSFVVTGNWRAYFTKTRVRPYMLLGIGILIARGDLDGEDVVIRSGLGLDINITEHWAGVAEVVYVPAINKLSDFDYMSAGVGIQYNF